MYSGQGPRNGASPPRQSVTWAASAGSPQSASPGSAHHQSAAGLVPKLPLASASAVAAASTAAGSLLAQHPLSSRSSAHHQSKWHVPYSFVTPVEKRLQKQLEAIKHNPEERAALEARLSSYKEAEQPARAAREALLAANKLTAATLTADARMHQLQEEARARQEHMKQVKQQHKQREEEQQAARLAAAQRSEMLKQQRLQQEAAWEAQQLAIFQSKQWSGIIRSTSYLTQVLSAVRQLEQTKLLASHQEAAVITIQRYWRGYRQRSWYQRVQRAVRLLQAACRRHLGSTAERSSRRLKAAECCLRFIMEFHGQSHLKLAVKHVQRAVLRDVRLVKQLDVSRTAQYLLLTQQWTALETKMLALARRRAGADTITAAPNSKGSKQSKLAAQLEARKRGTAVALASRRTTGADDVVAAPASSSSADGPSPSSCHGNDRLLLEDLCPTPLELKGLLAQVYLRMKARQYVAVIGLYWRDKAAVKRAAREQGNLAAARSILRGAQDPLVDDGVGSSSSSNSSSSNTAAQAAGPGPRLPASPCLPPFRATGTMQELAALMQQAVAETPFFEAAIARQDLDEYRAKLEEELTARRKQHIMEDFANNTQCPKNSQANVNCPGSLASEAATTSTVAPARWAQETLQRMEACLHRRFVLAGCSLVAGMSSIPATRPNEWDDVTLSGLLYKS